MRAVVIGAGEVGFQISFKLVRERADVVLVDIDARRLEQVADSLDIQTVTGYGANPETLERAAVAESDLLVAVTSHDETNIMACRMAQFMAPPELRRVARVRASGYNDFFDDERLRAEFGLDFIINPGREAMETIMDFIEFPGVTDIIDLARGRLKLVGSRLSRHSRLLNKPLAQLMSRDDAGAANLLIVAIYRHHDLLIPRGDTILRAGDLVYVAAGRGDEKKVVDFFGLDPEPIRSLTIVGGGEVGYQLAKRLEADDERKFDIKLIELLEGRSEYLVSRLERTMVICGDGTDQELLLEENIGERDAFVAVSTNDEKNLISCLVAKRLGVRHTITRVNRVSYAPLVAAIGLEALVSAGVAAVSAVLKYIRKGWVISVATLANEDAEIIEFQVADKTKVAGRRLMDLKFPSGSLVCALSRGDKVLIPRGDTEIQAGDIMAVVAKAETIGALEKLLGGR